MLQSTPSDVRRGAAWRDWKVWLGVLVSAGCLWLAARDIAVAQLLAALHQANLPLLIGLTVTGYLGVTLFQSLRWRHLTGPVAAFPRSQLYRGVAIGFMVNNLLPLRIGELVRSWYLARASGRSGSAILGTVVLERVIDVACVFALAAAALYFIGADATESELLRRGAILILPIGAAPLAVLLCLRFFPEPSLALLKLCGRLLPARLSERLLAIARQFIQGLGAISGGSHLLWIAVHSLVLWLVFATLPMLSALLAFDIDPGSTTRLLLTSWILLAVVGVAVALPSAPGFLGVYQLAFREVLEGFGVDPATALAMGMATWVIFWLTLTLQGLWVLRLDHLQLHQLSTTSQPGEKL